MSLDANTRSEYQYLNYTIEAETFNNNRKYSRVWFGRDSSRPHSINRKIKISDTNKEYCDQHTVYIKENTRDILSPLKVSSLERQGVCAFEKFKITFGIMFEGLKFISYLYYG